MGGGGVNNGCIIVTSNMVIEHNCLCLLNFTDLYWIFRMDLTQATKKRYMVLFLTLFQLDQDNYFLVSFVTNILHYICSPGPGCFKYG